MDTRFRALLLLPALLPLLACEGGEPSSLVARAAGHDLTVPESVDLLAGEQLPNQPDVVRTLADLWVDYTLLAEAAARDSTLQNLDFQPVIRQQLEQEMILALRDTVVRPDTAITEEEIQRRFSQEAPGVRVRARHILVGFPEQATEAQRDSVRELAESLRRRVLAGESFEDLARQHSQDRGSAVEGGDLGWFDREQMVKPFSDAAFALEPGEVSEVVETPFGLHVIRVEEKETPSIDEVRDRFRSMLQQERFQAAESAFVAGVEEGAELEMVEGSPELVRELAADPGLRLSRRARARALVRFDGGEFTVGELQAFLQTRAPQFRFQLRNATDEVIQENFLRGLAQRELLVMQARERGLEIDQARADSLGQQLRDRFVDVARQLEILPVEARAGESREAAIDRRVDELLTEMLRGERDVVPLGAFSFLLREMFAAQVYQQGVERVVARLEEVRGPAPQPGQPGTGAPAPGTPPPGAPPLGDTAGAGAAPPPDTAR